MVQGSRTELFKDGCPIQASFSQNSLELGTVLYSKPGDILQIFVSGTITAQAIIINP